MVKEGCDVKIANTKTIQLNDLAALLCHDQKHDNRVAVEARILYFLEEDVDRAPQY